MADKEKLQAIKDEIERRIKNVSLILNICNTEDLTKEEEFGYHVEQETLKSLLIFINSFQEYPSPKFKIGNTIRDKEGKTGAFTITDIKVEDKSLVYLGNKRQKVSIWCQDDYEIVNNDLLVKENPASKDLEKSSKHYLLSGHISPLNDILHQADLKTEMQYHKDIEDAFKAGAEWQKQQMKEALQTEYEKGRFDTIEEMMKDAVDGEEIWKPIVGFEEYEVSNKGRVLSRKQKLDGVLLKQQTNLVGYKYVTLRDKKYNPHLALVHRLVAEAFIPNPFKKPTVNHIDEDKGNNIVSNLEWATYIEQKNHGSQKRPDVCPSMIDSEGRQSRRLISTRAYLRKCKYIIDDLNMIAYYDDNTHRSKKFEEEKRFYNYKPYNGEKFDRLPFITRPQKSIEVVSDKGVITVYKNISQAAKSLGVSVSLVKRRLDGIGGTSGNFAKLINYTFKYNEN